MEKEQMIKKVEVAHQVYELLKQFPVNERSQVISMVDNFNQDDWRVFHNSQMGEAKCATGVAGRPVGF